MQDVNEVDAGPLRLQNQPTFSTLTLEPSLTCKHPQYASAEARRQTFLVGGVTIPRGQNIEVLVDAGFFHVGTFKHITMQYIQLSITRENS